MIRAYDPPTDKESVVMKYRDGITDVVEAMSSFRPYRPARSLSELLGELRGGRGEQSMILVWQK